MPDGIVIVAMPSNNYKTTLTKEKCDFTQKNLAKLNKFL